MPRNIVKNKIQCKACHEIIESTKNHEFKMCKCGTCGVDGGLEYLRRIGGYFIELSEFSETEK